MRRLKFTSGTTIALLVVAIVILDIYVGKDEVHTWPVNTPREFFTMACPTKKQPFGVKRPPKFTIPSEYYPHGGGVTVFFRYPETVPPYPLNKGMSPNTVFGVINGQVLCKKKYRTGRYIDYEGLQTYLHSLEKIPFLTINGVDYYEITSPEYTSMPAEARNTIIIISSPSSVYYVSELERFFSCGYGRCKTVFDGSYYVTAITFPEAYMFQGELPAAMKIIEANLRKWGI